MDKIKKKLNNSASLGKTVARGPQPHSKSFFVEPADFVHTSQRKQSSIKKKYGECGSTSKVSSVKGVPPKAVTVTGSITNIQHNRKVCQKLAADLQCSTIEKNITVNKLLRQLHHFSICIEELKWLLTEGDKLIQEHLKETKLISPQSTYTQDVGELAREFRSLVLRFGSIEKVNLKSIQEYLKHERQGKEERMNTGGFSLGDTRLINLEKKQKKLTESIEMLKQKEETRQNSIMMPKHYSVPMKENVNQSNLSVHFQNIKLMPPKSNKDSKIEFASNPLRSSLKPTLEEEFQCEKQNLYSKLQMMQQENQALLGKIEMLKDDIAVRDNKITKYKVVSSRSVQQLGDILKRLTTNLTKGQKEFELLKIAQCLSSWQKMIDQQIEAARYNSLVGDSNAMNLEKTQKLEEIVGLQYQINSLLGQKKLLQNKEAVKSTMNEIKNVQVDEFYRMLSIQAVSLEQLCNL